MSDTRRVDLDTKHVNSNTTKCSVSAMHALVDPKGMATNERAAFWLARLMDES